MKLSRSCGGTRAIVGDRVLFVATVSQHLRAFHLPFARWLRLRGIEVHGAAAGISKCTECRTTFDQVHEIPFSRSPGNLSSAAICIWRLRLLQSMERFSLVHAHTPVASLLTRLSLGTLDAGSRPKLIYTAHGFHFHGGRNWWQNLPFVALEKLGGAFTDELLVINQEDYNASLRWRLASRDRLTLVSGAGLDVEKFSTRMTARSSFRSDLGAFQNVKIVAFVAELSPVKRHMDVLMAWRDHIPRNVHLLLCGVGATENALREFVSVNQLGDRIHFLGYRRDIPDILLESDAAILASEREGLPMSILECMALGVPVAGSDVRGIRDLLSGGCGVLFPLGDARALARAVERLVERTADVAQLIERAKRRSAEYTLRRVIDQQARVYWRQLSEKYGFV